MYVAAKDPITIPPKAQWTTDAALDLTFPFPNTTVMDQTNAAKVTGSASICACKSPYKKVNNGNSVIGPDSVTGCGIIRVAFQYHSPVPIGTVLLFTNTSYIPLMNPGA